MNKLYKGLSVLLILGMLSGCVFTGCGNNDENAVPESTVPESTETVSESVLESESEEASVEESQLVEEETKAPAFDWSKLYEADGFWDYEDDYYEGKVVLDFSDNQTVKDWDALKAAGVDAVILRLGSRGYTEGNIIEDTHFAANYKHAVANGMRVYGVYFFSQAVDQEEAEEEAEYVNKVLSKVGVSRDVIVYYDIETGVSSNGIAFRNHGLSNKQILKNVAAFADIIEENGYVTGVYTNLYFPGRRLKRSMFKDYPLWYACYEDEPDMTRGFTVWQYSGVGLVDGISGHVDLNLLFERKDTAAVDNGTSQNSGGTENTVETTQEETTAARITKEKIQWNENWEYASYSEIHSDSCTLYYSNAANRKDIVVAVNAGHGTSGGESVYTQCHPDGSAKVVSGSTSAGSTSATAVAGGTSMLDGTTEATVTLRVAKLVKKKLLKAGYDVLMIRNDSDCQLDNIARTVMANNNADCHISIHYDSSESDKGFFYISVPQVDSYLSMEPVASHWKEHDALGEAILSGMQAADVNIWSSGSMAIDLTQTSYSTIPSVDLEVGDRASDYSSATLNRIAKGIVKGIGNYFG